MPYPNEHAARLRDPDQYDEFRRENDAGGDGIDFIYGIKDGTSELQAIRFDSDVFSVDQARQWLDDNDFEPILFEPAENVDTGARSVLCSQQSLEVRMAEREIRALSQPVEVRADDNGVIRVAGYAAIFGEETNIAGMFTETIERGAFKSAIERGDDVVFLINHEGLPLARTRSGTLKLSEDERGLYMETELDPDDPDVRSIVPKMKRGDLDKMSFAFVPTQQSWDENGAIPKRTIQDVELFDVAIVTTPAYAGTEIGLRSLEAHRAGQVKSQAARRMRMKARQPR
jgi:HK97 family phage prohead protease